VTASRPGWRPGTEHLPGLRDAFAVVTIEKIKRDAGAAGGRYKLHTVFFYERGFFHPVNESQALQRLVGERQQGFPDVVAGKFFPLQTKRPQTGARAKRGAYGSSGSTADDCHIKDFHRA